jgi:hypothetical protein
MARSAFDDTNREPSDREVAKVLLRAAGLWDELKGGIASRFDKLAEAWTYSGKQWGWALRLTHKWHPLLYMTPSKGHFFVGFALGEKAVGAAHQADLPLALLEIIDASPRYAEGRAVRFEVRTFEEVGWALGLAKIKMAN